MHFTGEISLGSLLIAITIIGSVLRLGWKIGHMEEVATTQGANIERHTMRMDKYEERLIVIAGEIQRMIGRLQATQERLEKTTGHRNGEDQHR